MNSSTMLTNYTSMVSNKTSGILNDTDHHTTDDPLTTTQIPVSDNNREVARLIQVIMRPMLVVLGTYGNAVSFYIMRRGSLKKVSTCFYMAILAIADTRE